jgi:transposase
VVNGILFRQRTGVPWCDLPARFGKWKTVHDRHRRWSADGTWERLLLSVQAHADAEGQIDWNMVSVDSTTCRVHQHAASARTDAPRTLEDAADLFDIVQMRPWGFPWRADVQDPSGR